MTDDMNGSDGIDNVDDVVIRGARDYNAPGPVPREEMWARIQSARQTRVTPIGSITPKRRWMIPSAIVAAGLILGAGIVIGRRTEQPVVRSVAAVRDTMRTAMPPRLVAAVPAKPVPDSASRDSLLANIHEQTRKTDQRIRELAVAERSAARPEPSDGLAYRLVLLRHLAGSEALITSFRQAARGGPIDPKISAWSHELLNTTRLLESMDETRDPTMKRMLDDLDLIITQIVQYADKGTASTEELDLIEMSIAKRGVMTKLRRTFAAGNLPAGT